MPEQSTVLKKHRGENHSSQEAKRASPIASERSPLDSSIGTFLNASDGRERMEAEWFGYSAKVKPGSRLGTGGRKAYKEPSWTISKQVREQFRLLKFGNLGQAKEGFREAVIRNSNVHIQSPSAHGCHCRRVPYAIAKDSQALLRVEGFRVTPASAFYTICSANEAQGPLNELCNHFEDVVLIGHCVAIDLHSLEASLPSLRCLFLSENGIGPVGVKKIFCDLKDNLTIGVLSISENSVGDVGCQQIPKSLPFNRNVKSLCLAVNEIGDEGARFISSAIKPCNCHDLMTKAIVEDQVEVFELLIGHGYPFKSSESNGEGLIFLAVTARALQITEFLLDQGVDVDSKDNKGASVVTRAAKLGFVEILELLISRGADASCCDFEGRTPLIEAAVNGHSDAVSVLAQALSFLARTLHVCVHSLEYLPQNQPLAEGKKPEGSRWFSLEGLQGSVTAMNKRQSRRSSANIEGFLKGASNLATFMTSKINRKDGEFLNDSIKIPSSEMHAVEITQDCYMSLEFDSQTYTIPVPACPKAENVKINHRTSFKAIKSSADFVQVTLFEKVEGNDKQQRILGRCTIQLSSFAVDQAKVRDFWCEICDEFGFKVACVKVSVHCILDLFNERTKIGQNALMHAARSGMHYVVANLGSNGADVDAADRDGNSSLILGSRFGHTEVVKSLLCLRANIDKANRSGINALMAAQQQGHSTVVQILLGHDMVLRGIPLSIKRWQTAAIPKKGGGVDAEKGEGACESFCFKVIISEARNLPIADISGLSDPFCVVTLNHQERRTGVLQRTLNPKWNQELQFDNALLTIWENQSLLIEVFDSNLASSPVLLGKKKLEMSRLISMHSNDPDQWAVGCFHLVDETGSLVEGQQDKDLRNNEIFQISDITIKFRFLHGRGKFLRLGIIEAKNLPQQRNKILEPYCVAKYGEETFQTHSVSRIANLKWDLYVSFTAKSLDDTLVVTVYDRSSRLLSTSAKDDVIVGFLEIPMNIILALISVNLSDLDLELSDENGSTLKGSGGRVSSIHLSFELVSCNEKPLQTIENQEGKENTVKRNSTKLLSADAYQYLKRKLESHSLLRQGDSGHNEIIGLSTELLKDHAPDNMRMPFNSESCSDLGGGEPCSQSLNEVIINKDVSATVGQRVTLRDIIKNMNPSLAAKTGEGPGIIIRVNSAPMNPFHASQPNEDCKDCVVWWDKTGQEIAHYAGLEGQYHLSLYELPSEITLEELMSLEADHSITSLERLNLDYNQISDTGATYLSNALQNNICLQVLSIRSNKIRSDGADALGKCLLLNGSLTHLRLSSNRIGDEGLREICKALETNKSTKVAILDVGDNCIGPTGMRFLAKMIIKNSTLKVLNVKRNLIGGDGALLLAQGLRKNKVISELDVSNNVIGDIGACSLTRALRRMPDASGRRTLAVNTALNSLNLARNNLTDQCVMLIIDSLKYNRTLHTVILDGNKVSEEVLQTLSKCILSNVETAQLEKSVSKIQKAFRACKHRKRKAEEVRMKHVQPDIIESKTTVTSIGHTNTQTLLPALEAVAFSESQAIINESTAVTLADNNSSTASNEAVDADGCGRGELQSGENLLLTATRVTMFNMADAVILEHAAALAMAQEAASRLLEAGKKYSKLEDRFYELLTNEEANQVEIIAAVEELNQASEEIAQALNESNLAEQAGMKCFQAAEAFALCEKEEAKIVGTVRGIHDWQNADALSVESNILSQSAAADINQCSPNSFEAGLQVQPNEQQHITSTINESDEKLIAEAVEEFSRDDVGTLTAEEVDSFLNEYLDLQHLLTCEIGEEIAACCALTSEEAMACRLEIEDLQNLEFYEKQELEKNTFS